MAQNRLRLRVLPSLLPMQVEFQSDGTNVQWRYVGEDWQDLVAVDDLAASVTVGTVATLTAGSPATVTNVGSTADAILNFGIPAGADGVGSGDLSGPAGAVDARVAVFDGITGKLVKDGGHILSEYLTTTAAASAYQPLDSDLTAIAALATASYGRALLTKAAAEDVRTSLAAAPYVATRTALKALDTTKDTVAILTEAGREGTFVFRSGDYSTLVTADTQEGIYVKATAIASSAGAWVRLFSGNYNVKWWGAIGDNSTDNQTAIQNAIDVIPSATGGTLFFPAGVYKFSGTLDAHGRTSFVLLGESTGYALQSRFFGSVLISTQTGSGDGINLRGCSDSGLRDISAGYTSGSYTGVLVNMGVSAGVGGFMDNVLLHGYSVATASALLNLDKMVDASFKQVTFHSAVNCVIGQAIAGSSSSNVISFDSCVFYSWTTACINAPGDTWLFKNCTFEILSGGVPAFLNTNATFITSLSIVNCWFGDTTAAVTMLNLFNVSGLHIAGVHADGASIASTTFLKLTSTGGNLNYGVSITGCQISGFATGIDGNSSTTNGVHIAGNNFGNTTTPLTGTGSFTSLLATGNNPSTVNTLAIPIGVTLTGPAASGTAMTLGNTETVTGAKTFGSAGGVGKLKVAGTTSGSTILDATAVASGTVTLPAATDTLVGRATTDTLTNKTLDGGTLATKLVKGIYILGSSGVAAPLTGTTSPTTLATITVPAGVMGANGRIRVTVLTSNTNSANNKTIAIAFGATTYNSASFTTTISEKIIQEVQNRNATNSQIGGANIAGLGTSASAVQTSAIDTTSAVNITIVGTLANTGDTLTLESYLVELILP